MEWVREAIEDIASMELTMILMKSVASSLIDVEELEEMGWVEYSTSGLIRAATRGANAALVRALHGCDHAVDDEEIMELAIRTGNADFCEIVLKNITRMKKVELPKARSAVPLAAAVGSIAVCRWALINGTAAFDPFDALDKAAKRGHVDFMMWLHESFGTTLPFDEAQDLVQGAVVSESLATLKFCLEIWGSPRRRWRETARCPRDRNSEVQQAGRSLASRTGCHHRPREASSRLPRRVTGIAMV
jgi:hypothetical protein